MAVLGGLAVSYERGNPVPWVSRKAHFLAHRCLALKNAPLPRSLIQVLQFPSAQSLEIHIFYKNVHPIVFWYTFFMLITCHRPSSESPLIMRWVPMHSRPISGALGPLLAT